MSGGPRVLFAGGGTGGHLYPALALARELEQRDPSTETLFVGAERGVEARVLPERGVDHVLLPLQPIRRARPWENWRLLPAAAGVLWGLRKVFRDFRPNLVVGTGGYASGPVVAWAAIRGIPTAVQEQNSFPGLVTRWMAPRVRQLHLAFPEALRYLKPGPRTAVFELGNPIRPPDGLLDRDATRAAFGLGGGTVALVVGGSQGARAVNQALLADLAELTAGRLAAPPPGLEILWATGPAHLEAVAAEVKRLGVGGWVHARGYIEDMPRALAVADFAVSRAGAMALAELCAWGVPGILVPLPSAAANHQHHNAVALAEAGAAVLLPERKLGPGRLWGEILRFARQPEQRREMAERARERGKPHAAELIVTELRKLLGD